MRFVLIIAAAAAALAQDTESLRPETLAEFQTYVRGREARMERERVRGERFLWTDEDAARRDRVRAGDVAVEAISGKGAIEVKGGLIHDWIGAMYLPGVTLKQVLDVVQNYDGHKEIYGPEVMESKLRRRDGNRFQVHLRLLKKKVITVVLNTEHDAEFFPLDAKRVHSRSYSTRIAEVADAGSSGEHERPLHDSHGFLWRLNSYWRFHERDGGVWVECEAISLTRGVPFGLGMIVMPIVRDLPRESLQRTMQGTRDGMRRAKR